MENTPSKVPRLSAIHPVLKTGFHTLNIFIATDANEARVVGQDFLKYATVVVTQLFGVIYDFYLFEAQS